MSDVITKETTTTHNQNMQTPGENLKTQTVVSAATQNVAPSQTVINSIYFFFSCLDILLIFRLALKLTGANPGSGFVAFIYSLSRFFVAPFLGIFPVATTRGAEVTAVFEPATLVALVVYAVLAWIIVKLFVILSRKPLDTV